MIQRICLLAACAWLSGSVLGQTTQPADRKVPESRGKAAEIPAKAAMPSIIQQLPDYTGDLARRQYLTGDWGGARADLSEHGVLFELSATQILQDNAHGGKDTNNGFRYAGSADYTLKLDSARMNLWPGGLLTLHGETQFGQSVMRKTGAVLPPNFDALLPLPDDGGLTTLSEFYLTQAFSEQFVVVLGKINGLGLGDMTEFAANETTQFMNTGFRLNPMLGLYAPYTAMTAAAVYMPTKWLKVTSGISDNDPNGAATRTGFNTTFHGRDWLSVSQEWELTIKPFGQTGHQRFGWAWSSRDRALLDQDIRINLPTIAFRQFLSKSRPLMRLARLAGATRSFEVDTRPDDWMMYYNFDQYLYTKPDDPAQGFGLFGRFGFSTGESNPFDQFYSLGLGGKGLIPTRAKDSYGVGYFLANLSNDLPAILSASDEQGVEAYYNIEVTPWLHVSPDLQVIVRPGGGFQDRETALVCGLRMQMTF
ncbi:MAG: carbohydrate porin [Phycisphaerae bacterium]|nr:carbohydrate porin [Phycisphaerae bacterium]